MKISIPLLTPEGGNFDLAANPYYAVLDMNEGRDFYFPKCEEVSTVTGVLLRVRLGRDIYRLPVSWRIMCGAPGAYRFEQMPFTAIGSRGDCAGVLSPLSFAPRTRLIAVDVVDAADDDQPFHHPTVAPGQWFMLPVRGCSCVMVSPDMNTVAVAKYATLELG